MAKNNAGKPMVMGFQRYNAYRIITRYYPYFEDSLEDYLDDTFYFPENLENIKYILSGKQFLSD
jgi:hypothetical protein